MLNLHRKLQSCLKKALLYHKENVFTYGSEERETSDVGKVTWFVRY